MIERLTAELRRRVAQEVSSFAARAEQQGREVSDTDQRQQARAILRRELDQHSKAAINQGLIPLNNAEREQVIESVMDSVFSVMPGLNKYLSYPDVTDIFVNGYDDVRLVLIDGTTRRVDPFCESDAALIEMIQTIARRAGRMSDEDGAGRANIEKEFTPSRPILDLELSDGSRLAAAAWVTERPYVAVRRHLLVDADLDDLVARDMLDAGLATFLRAALKARLNIMFAGTTGVGKTTLMRALLHECHPDERLMVMEQEPELHLASDKERHNQVLQWLERPANMEGQGAISYGDLSTALKRFRPERLVVGEVRGPEVVDMMEAITSGQRGSACTIHADSSWSVFPRLAIYARRGGTPWRTSDIKELASLAINLVVYLDYATDGHRVISEIRHVVGYDSISDNVVTNELFMPDAEGATVPNPDAPLPRDLRDRLISHGYNPNLHFHGNGVQR